MGRVGSRSSSNASVNVSISKRTDHKRIVLGGQMSERQGKLLNNQGNTTLGALPSNIDKGRSLHVAQADLFGRTTDPHSALKGLKKEFVFPPFSVFNAREGDWQARKRLWVNGLGIKSELGRGENQTGETAETVVGKYGHKQGNSFNQDTINSSTEKIRGKYGRNVGESFGQDDINKFRGKLNGQPKSKYGHKAGASISDHFVDDLDYYRHQSGKKTPAPEQNTMTGVSVFDPVLCELTYRWFCPPGGQVLDPFAGGSVRGIVAAALGREYFGVDLSARQIAANREQVETICKGWDCKPMYHAGDSRNIRLIVENKIAAQEFVDFSADLVFSCPPYADLETYSLDPADISNMPYEQFLDAYRKIIRRSCKLLKDNRFAVWVVTEVRDTRKKHGPYYGLVPDTIRAFQDAGLDYYNEGILLTAVGSLPLRTRQQFHSGRKFGRTHQNILYFVKGDPRKAAFPL